MNDSLPSLGVRKTAIRWSSLVAVLALMISACGGNAEDTPTTKTATLGVETTATPGVETTTSQGESSTTSGAAGEQTTTSEPTNPLPTSVFAVTLDTATATWLAPGDVPTWSPDGSQIAFTTQAEDGGNAVFVIDSAGGTGLFLAPGAQPTWSPDGSQIAFTTVE